MKKNKNELEILDQFRLKASREEMESINALKREFKKNPIVTTASYLIEGITSPFFGEGQKFLEKSYDNFLHLYKSSIRDYAISEVYGELRRSNKKLYEVDIKKLELKILVAERKVKKKRDNSVIRKVILMILGIGFLPFV